MKELITEGSYHIIVIDYLRQARKGDEYLPEEATITHVDEILKLMQVMTGDRRFENVRNNAPKEKGDRQMVKSYFDVVEAEGIAKGIAKGRAEGKAEGRITALKEVMQRLIANGMSREEAAAITGLSE